MRKFVVKKKSFINALLVLLLMNSLTLPLVAATHRSASPTKIKNKTLTSNVVTQKIVGDSIWQDADDAMAMRRRLKHLSNLKSINPAQREGTGAHRTLRLDRNALAQVLSRAPLERTEEAKRTSVEINLPMSHGAMMRFRIFESPMMESELAAAHPELKTYTGQGIDDPNLTTRFSLTPQGFNAIILGAEDTTFIRPLAGSPDAETYISYSTNEFQEAGTRPACDVTSFVADTRNKFGARELGLPNARTFVSGDTLRTYRLVIATTGEWTTQYGGGTVNGALAAVMTLQNLVNAVFEREVAVRFLLINDTTKVIFTNSTGIYTNGSTRKMLDQNVGVLNERVGNANFDIGHVLGTGGGGVAYLQSVCDTDQKGGGVTLQDGPIGNNFDTSTLAHEYGHQFGANHIFNGAVDTSCRGARTASAAFEPGNGNSIMSYAGSCDASDEVSTPPRIVLFQFHPFNYDEIQTFVNRPTGGDQCSVKVATNNRPPVVTVGANRTIPARTPFRLQVASASDPDGDVITYEWAEFDLAQAAGPPNNDADGKERPLFRSAAPTNDPSRTFPQISNILDGNLAQNGETLPAITRTMNFRVTVRDNRAGGGGVNTATTQLNVVGDAGPFVVTAPVGGATFTGGSTQTVSWNPANTNAAPINAANVRITLSTNGGDSFPNVLAASVPNNGTAIVTIPNIATARARVRVEAVDNVFFNISPANFTINATDLPAPSITGFTPASGPVGERVEVMGVNFGGATSVKFNGVDARFALVPDSTSELNAFVPAGATTGAITVTTPTGTATSATNFTVIQQPSFFTATLNGAQVVPPSSTTATGTATLLLSTDGTTATVSLSGNGFADGQSTATINGPAAIGANGAVLFTLPASVFNNGTANITLTTDQAQSLRNGLLYITVSVGGVVGGTVRGQFTQAGTGVTNPIDEARFFVRQQYLDFLNREPDPSGFAFWTNEINSCNGNAQCIDIKRQNVSAAYFLSTEFQQTGYLVYRLYKTSFNRLPRFQNEFLPDTQTIGQGVVVGQPGADQKLEQNIVAFINNFVNRAAFKTQYPDTLTAAQFVDALNVNTGNSLTQAERDTLVNGLTAGTETRATVLRKVAANQAFTRREFNSAFVLLQYFGYLRRNPDDAPDNNLGGYNFWLNKLTQFGGDYIRAEMVRSFILSEEYRRRFGQP